MKSTSIILGIIGLILGVLLGENSENLEDAGLKIEEITKRLTAGPEIISCSEWPARNCQRCGSCRCTRYILSFDINRQCPLHGEGNDHAKGKTGPK